MTEQLALEFPRPRSVILAELRECAERHVRPELLAWCKVRFPEVFEHQSGPAMVVNE